MVTEEWVDWPHTIPNTISAKRSNPEMKVITGNNCSLEDHVWGEPHVSRNTRRLSDLNSQFLRFREMVKLPRMGKCTN